MDGMAWEIVAWASAVATAAATAFTALAAAWWRRMDRQEADWAVFNVGATWHRVMEPDGKYTRYPEAECDIANAGDGSAFRFRVTGLGCTPKLHGEARSAAPNTRMTWRPGYEVVPLLAPGDQVHLTLACEPEDWDRAVVVIEWIRSPTWRRQRSRKRVDLTVRSLGALPPETEVRPDSNGIPTVRAVHQQAAPVPRLPEPLRPQLPPPPSSRAWWRRRRPSLQM